MNNTDDCPVCGMKSVSGRYAFEYHKMQFQFCSEQCREMFATHPTLYSRVPRKEYGEVAKRRRLRLAQSQDQAHTQALEKTLKALMGVKEVYAKDQQLTVRYDLLQVTLARIESVLSANGISLHNGMWQKFKRSWVRHIEENELENLARGPEACCNRPPPRL